MVVSGTSAQSTSSGRCEDNDFGNLDQSAATSLEEMGQQSTLQDSKSLSRVVRSMEKLA